MVKNIFFIIYTLWTNYIINYNISNYDDAGLHYGNSDYKKIYSDIMKYVGLNNSISREYQLYNLDDYCEFIYVDGENSSNGCEEMSISSTVLSSSYLIILKLYPLLFTNRSTDLLLCCSSCSAF